MKLTMTEEQMQKFADTLEDVFYAGRCDETGRDDSKDWRRVALCAIMEISELAKEQEAADYSCVNYSNCNRGKAV